MSQPRVAVVGGGIAGTLCSLVLKNRGIAPTILDAGSRALGGRLRGGAPCLRATDPRLVTVYSMLEQQGLLKRWEGRFGVLGSSGGGFLPSEIVTRGKRESDNEHNNRRATASDGGDFCHFADGSTIPTYVGVPSTADLCEEICRKAGIGAIGNARVLGATPSAKGWTLQLREGANGESMDETPIFDGLVLATHDASFTSKIVRSILEAEVAAGASDDEAGALVVNRLSEMTDALQQTRQQGRMPAFTLLIEFPSDFMQQQIPFDAVSVPGSPYVQFLSRSSNSDNVWTAVSTSAFASDLLARSTSEEESLAEASRMLEQEVTRLLSPYEVPSPTTVSVKRWGAAFTSQSLNLKEDSIVLAPWRLTVCGDYIREMSAHATPSEAAALSGLEAGERAAAFFVETEAKQ